MDPESILLRSADFYSSHDIEVILGKEVSGEAERERGERERESEAVSVLPQATGVDVAGKKVSFSDGEAIGYDKLLLATGSKSVPVSVCSLCCVVTMTAVLSRAVRLVAWASVWDASCLPHDMPTC